MTTQRNQTGNRGSDSMDKQSNKSGSSSRSSTEKSAGGQRGGSSEQHAKAGRQSHKNG